MPSPRASAWDFRIWRLTGTALILAGFASPWIEDLSAFVLMYLLLSLSSGAVSPEWWRASLPLLAILAGLACALAYAVWNLRVAWQPRGMTNRFWALLPLLGGTAGLLITGLWFTSDIDAHQGPFQLLWGHWLTWAGMLVSAAVELADAIGNAQPEVHPE